MNINQIISGAKGLLKLSLKLDPSSEDLIKARLEVCNKCPENVNNKCDVCRCYILLKIKIRKEICPKRYW